MRVAVYGGSFNPPHVAHGMVASWLLETYKADEVWLVPVFRHAFEGIHSKRLADFSLRVEWCRALACDEDARIRVSEVEAQLPVPSFTIDTLDHLSKVHPDHFFRLVVGADVLDQVEKWRDWSGISRRFSPIVVGREGHGEAEGTPLFPGISSTEIRRRLKSGDSVADLVTPSVASALGAGEAWE